MKYYRLQLQIPGDYGKNVVYRHDPLPEVVHVHFEFDLDPDAFFEKIGDYFASAAAKRVLLESGLSGFRFGDQIETSVEPESAGLVRSGTLSYDDVDSWVEPDPSKRFPHLDPNGYFAMTVDGEVCKDDFGVTESLDLVVSQRALDLLQKLGIPEAEVTPYEDDA